MKILGLNNKGWGLKEMLIITGILFFFLLIACYYVFVLYKYECYICLFFTIYNKLCT